MLQVKRARSSLNSGDVFILDLGLEIFQFNGNDSNKDERFKVSRFSKFTHISLIDHSSQILEAHSCNGDLCNGSV